MNVLMKGFAAGLLATVPMTVAMLALNRWLPKTQPDPLPPLEITENMAEKTGVASLRPSPAKRVGVLSATSTLHFLYGGAMGALFAPMAARMPGTSSGKGIGYGLLVWSGSYLGLMPALELYPSATREPARMNALMILAHILWGGTTGLLLGRWQPNPLRNIRVSPWISV